MIIQPVLQETVGMFQRRATYRQPPMLKRQPIYQQQRMFQHPAVVLLIAAQPAVDVVMTMDIVHTTLVGSKGMILVGPVVKVPLMLVELVQV